MPGMLSTLTEDQILDYDLPNERITKLSAEDAFALGMAKMGIGDKGRDPTFWRHQRNWFISVAYTQGFANAEALAAQIENLGYATYNEVSPIGYQANKILRFVRQEVSRLSRAKPSWSVIPKSPDMVDRYGAKVAKALLDHFYDDFDMRQKRETLATWTAICGMGYYYTGWNAKSGGKKRVYKSPYGEGRRLVDDEIDGDMRDLLESYGSFEDVTEGDFDIDVLSPFQVKVPLGESELDKMPWLIVTRLRDIDWIWEHYPDKAKEIDADRTAHSLDTHWWRRLVSLAPIDHLGPEFVGGTISNGIEVHELWIPPRGRLPNGLKVTFTTNNYLDHEDHPFHKVGLDIKYPVIPCYWFKLPGRFYGKGLVEDLIPVQNDRNHARNDLNEHRQLMSRPQIIAPDGANISEVSGDIATIWTYEAGSGPPPQMWDPPAISQSHVATIDMDDRDMSEMAAMSDATMGDMPQGARSGNAVAMLQERDQDAIGSTVSSLEMAQKLFGQNVLKLAHAFMKTPRRIAVYGTSRQMDIRMFNGADISGNTAVQVQANSMMPRSAALAKQRVMELLQVGALDPMNPQHMRTVVKVFNDEVGDLDAEFDLYDGHKRRAEVEEGMFLMPDSDPAFALPDVEPHDDHVAHLESHNLMLTTDDFELMPPIRKQAFLAHLAEHQRHIAQMIQTQMLAQQSAGGGGGGGSPPKEPGEASQPRARNETPGSVSAQS